MCSSRDAPRSSNILTGGDRVIAAYWPEQMDGADGLAWADLGRDTNDSSFPFHFILMPNNSRP
jgi:hypothetical protein